MTRHSILCSLAGLCLLGATHVSAQQQPPAPMSPAATQEQPAGPLKQAQQSLREGDHEKALATLQDVIAKAPASSPEWATAQLQTGIVLDLLGRYDEARAHIGKAIDAAANPEDKARAQRTMAVSYAFERNCDGAEKSEAPLYESYLGAKNFYAAGDVANELARVCLESGSTDKAETWYKRGYEAGLQEPGIKPDRRDLWEFRWEHAQARIAARRGNQDEAKQHVAAARAIFDKGTNSEQAQFVPYLVGYVAFYGGDYKTALAELQRGNQNDPFILSLIAQSCEKLGDKAQATEYYRKVLASNAHNPTNAFARPLAKEKLGTK